MNCILDGGVRYAWAALGLLKEGQYKMLKEQRPDLIKKIEAELTNDAYLSYLYAELYLNGRFPAGEAAIAKDASASRFYKKFLQANKIS